jgi:hypothetical protein
MLSCDANRQFALHFEGGEGDGLVEKIVILFVKAHLVAGARSPLVNEKRGPGHIPHPGHGVRNHGRGLTRDYIPNQATNQIDAVLLLCQNKVR